MQSTPKKIVVVAGAIVENGRLLIALRGKRMTSPGLWELPGGKVEPGETYEKALERELMEEIGVRVRVGERLAESKIVVGKKVIHMHVFLCKRMFGEPTSLEHVELKWVEESDLNALNWAPADVPLISEMGKWLCIEGSLD